MHYKSVTITAALGGLLLLTAPVSAAATNHGDFAGVTVMYRQVTEDSATDPGPLFGAPTVAGDSLDFNPTGFVSSSSAGSIDSTIGVLDFTIEAMFANVISDIQFREAGDYTIFGAGDNGTSATVSAAVFINIVEVDGLSVTPINFNTNMVFTPSAGDYKLADDGAGFGVIWEGVLDIDVNQVLIDAGVSFNFGATEVKVILNNILATTSQAGSSSEIQKKDFQGLGVTAIPEPASLALLGMGAALIATRRR